ncbi:hypothetical protein M404DRAFT_765494 [Pisolithus tinctorius Marx 270]|uniref:Uncharacterized protein n=1 Tax=Pisolithus tinctorius Marx 270 TaxID=870435 RepID=A0A0C3NGR8_PISTI|nr:hypothetical protein M404DRAFT_765494 [Pisolithus tinctorius Marx 270]
MKSMKTRVGLPLVTVGPLRHGSHTNRATGSINEWTILSIERYQVDAALAFPVTSSSSARCSSSSSVSSSFLWSTSIFSTTEGMLSCLHTTFKTWTAEC